MECVPKDLFMFFVFLASLFPQKIRFPSGYSLRKYYFSWGNESLYLHHHHAIMYTGIYESHYFSFIFCCWFSCFGKEANILTKYFVLITVSVWHHKIRHSCSCMWKRVWVYCLVHLIYKYFRLPLILWIKWDLVTKVNYHKDLTPRTGGA